jgi:X-X-X-Leu-X-X-Gly heptad repeat protein
MSTAPIHSTTFAASIVYDPESGDHAMYLDGSLVGFARTHQEAQTILDQIVLELLSHRSSALPTLTIPPAFPLPPLDTIAEALGVLATHDDDPTIYADACQQLAAGVSIAAAGSDRLIDGVRVRRALIDTCWPWPWHCACGEERCWHGALLEGILLAWERLGEDPRPLPFEAVA